MLADLEELVGCESFSADHAALARSAEVVGSLGTRLTGAEPDLIVLDGVSHLRWTFGAPRVLLLGHHDTVWPIGSLRTHPWSVTAGTARGPGVLDMKGGLVMLFHALASLPTLDGVCVLINGDEEIGSPTSRRLIEETARSCAATLVLEPAADDRGTLKTARKGASRYEVEIQGRAAHAGLEPHRGINASVEAAHQILALASINASAQAEAADSPLDATTVTPTLLSAGTSRNTVPARARVSVDVRTPTRAAQNRIDTLIRQLTPKTPGARLHITAGARRPPMEPSSSATLMALATEIAAELGQAPLHGQAVGGASDGNHTAATGCPTLDGLGAVGEGAHADNEYAVIDQLIPRTRLIAELIKRTTS
ncbi:M20 family metallopeptidase [Streptomyces sp. NPDC059477]|uniref:M20 family metallopeptidase n=1 Tax=Streptomyces sp. NPDC059477 TaxID=3346847 RepID=UPI0036883193